MADHFIIAAGDKTTLPKVRDDLHLVVDYFTKELGYAHALPELMNSPSTDVFRRTLSDWFSSPDRKPSDKVVLYFSAHGEVDRRRHYLLLSDSDAARLSATAFQTSTLAAIPFEAGRITHLLAVLDTCYSGAGAADILSWLSTDPPEENCSIQVIAAARKKEVAQDGAFAPEFIEAIRNATAALGRRVQEYLAVDSIVEPIKGKLPPYQQATWNFAPAHAGTVLSPIRNPHFNRNIPAGLDIEDQEHYQRDLSTHFVPRAEGGEAIAPNANIWYFTGRRRALEEISTWLKEKPPGRWQVGAAWPAHYTL